MTKIFITKYSLNKGIIEAQGDLSERHPEMVFVRDGPYGYHLHKNEWHLTLS